MELYLFNEAFRTMCGRKRPYLRVRGSRVAGLGEKKQVLLLDIIMIMHSPSLQFHLHKSTLPAQMIVDGSD